MSIEQPDRTEPVTFYVAGAVGWSDPQLMALRARQQVKRDLEELFLIPEWSGEED